jgi:hypothetical protein
MSDITLFLIPNTAYIKAFDPSNNICESPVFVLLQATKF